jgi:glucosamine--fructose-6-phosphate aminotransferase (isomerizing)
MPAETDTPTPYPHWMLREIYEQPASLQATLDSYVAAGAFRRDRCGPARQWLRQDWHMQEEGGIVIAASGSSRHAAMVAELMIEDLSGIPVDVEYASESLYRGRSAPIRNLRSLIAVSQSGETADTLAVVRAAKAASLATLAVTNVASSSMARAATVSFPTAAGRERAIPATKSFTAQLLNLYLLALLAAQTRNTLSPGELSARLTEAAQLPQAIEAQLDLWRQQTQALAAHFHATSNFLYLGRDLHYPIAREGALKLKEAAYLHAEGYPSGELKHGPNALLSEGTALVMLATRDNASPGSVQRYAKSLQLMRDMRAQGVDILALVNTGDHEAEALATHVIFVAPMAEPLLCLCEVIPLQLLAYSLAVSRGIDVDRPRNLTKSVLTE